MFIKQRPVVLPRMSPLDSYIICYGVCNTSDHWNWSIVERILPKGVTCWRNHLHEFGSHIRAPRSPIITHGLCNVDITNVNKVNGLDLGGIKWLNILFTEPSDGSRPEFTNITALKLSSLSTFYYDSPPVIRDISLGDGDHGLTSLALCHVPSQCYDLTEPLPVYPSSTEEFDFSAVCSGNNLTNVTVVGGHDGIISQLNLIGALCLYWRQTCRQISPPIRVFPEAPLLGTFSFDSLLPDTRIPSFADAGPEELSIIGRDGLILNNLLTKPRIMTVVQIHCRGERMNRAVPSLTTCQPLLGRPWFAYSVSLYGFSRPPSGQDEAMDQLLYEFIRSWKTRVENVIAEVAP